jgi:ubiquinol-cytochrome c reductase iron-sulfur subunit
MSTGQLRSSAQAAGHAPKTGVGLVLLGLGSLAAVGAVIAFWLNASTQIFGGLIALSLVAGGAGLVAWAHGAMPDEPAVGEREPLASSAEERAAFVESFVVGEQTVGRRRLLAGSLVVLVGALSAMALSMVRSLGPDPLPILRQTAWRPGSRVVQSDGTPIKPVDVRVGSVVTVFPEGHLGAAESQTLLIKVQPDLLDLPPSQQAWAWQGLVAYSKICTHAGCPVGLYEQQQHLLLCPCHQSTFDVLRGAQPTSGPADRALPQLPLTVNTDGYLVSQSDYQTPVGPGFWSI